MSTRGDPEDHVLDGAHGNGHFGVTLGGNFSLLLARSIFSTGGSSDAASRYQSTVALVRFTVRRPPNVS